MIALPCPEPDCPVTEEFVNELGAHLIASHAYERPDAVQAAKRVQSQADPFGLDKHGITTHVEPAATPAVTPSDDPMPGEWGGGPKSKHRAGDVPVTCPRCPNEYPRRFALIQHLVDTHDLNGTEAMALAQQAERDAIKPPKEMPMARPCGHCKKVGHGRKDCPDRLEEKARKKNGEKNAGAICGRCKKPKANHAPNCTLRTGRDLAKAGAGGGTRRKKKAARPAASEPAVSHNGHRPLGDDVAKKAGETYVGHLKRIRENLDRLIGTVEESLAIL